MAKPTVLILASDPGAAKALLPVIQVLMDDEKVDLFLQAYGWAFSSWRKLGLNVTQMDETLSEQAARSYLEDQRISLFLSGTSHRQPALEQRFISAARSAGIPSLALLDFWSNYILRFSRPGGKLDCLPEKIAIMDEPALRAMVAEGFPPDRLVITGQPAFDDLAALQSRDNPYLLQAIRAGLEIQTNEIFVLFASQPMADYYNLDPARPGCLGYDERGVINSLIQVLEKLSRHHKCPIRLIIRPHPREDFEWMEAIKAKDVRVQILPGGNGRYLAMAANLVVGMNSILLVEACYLGCLVVSLQPGLLQPDPLPTNRSGFSRGVFRQEDILPGVEEMLFDAGVQKQMKDRLSSMTLDGKAALRVADLVYQMTGGGVETAF